MPTSNIIPFNKNRIKINNLIKEIKKEKDPLFTIYVHCVGNSAQRDVHSELSNVLGVPESVCDLILFGFHSISDSENIEIKAHVNWGTNEVVSALEWIRDNPENNKSITLVSEVFSGIGIEDSFGLGVFSSF